MFLIEFVVDLLRFPFKKFPRASWGLFAFFLGSSFGVVWLHTVLVTLWHQLDVLIGGSNGVHININNPLQHTVTATPGH